jgi:hypothetical protein
MSHDREIVEVACERDGFDVVVPIIAAALLEAAGRAREADLLRACDNRFEFSPGEARWTVYAPGWLFALNRDAFVELHDLIIAYAPDIAAALTNLEVLSRVNAPVAIEHLERLWDADDPRDIELPPEDA